MNVASTQCPNYSTDLKEDDAPSFDVLQEYIENEGMGTVLRQEMVYMPLQSSNGHMGGAEANSRFSSKETGKMYNTVQTFEKISALPVGQQRELTRLTMRRAMSEMKGIKDPEFITWINVAPDLIEPSFALELDQLVEMYHRCLKSNGDVGIEITEETRDKNLLSSENWNDGVGILSGLRPVAIDDVGQGAFTLDTAIDLLQRQPHINKCKLDKCWLNDPEELEKTVRTLHRIFPNVSIVFEGVEREYLSLIQEIESRYPAGAFVRQGYAIGKPMGAKDFMRYMKQNTMPPHSRRDTGKPLHEPISALHGWNFNEHLVS